MIYDTLNNLPNYLGMSENLDAVIEFVMARDINNLPAGKTRIDGDKAVVTVSTVTPQTSDKALFQRRDDHLTLETDLEGSELFGGEIGICESGCSRLVPCLVVLQQGQRCHLEIFQFLIRTVIGLKPPQAPVVAARIGVGNYTIKHAPVVVAGLCRDLGELLGSEFELACGIKGESAKIRQCIGRLVGIAVQPAERIGSEIVPDEVIYKAQILRNRALLGTANRRADKQQGKKELSLPHLYASSCRLFHLPGCVPALS